MNSTDILITAVLVVVLITFVMVGIMLVTAYRKLHAYAILFDGIRSILARQMDATINDTYNTNIDHSLSNAIHHRFAGDNSIILGSAAK